MQIFTGCIHCSKISIVGVSGGDGELGEFLIAVTRFFVASLTESFHSALPSLLLSVHTPKNIYCNIKEHVYFNYHLSNLNNKKS